MDSFMAAFRSNYSRKIKNINFTLILWNNQEGGVTFLKVTAWVNNPYLPTASGCDAILSGDGVT